MELKKRFQSTLPVGGATRPAWGRPLARIISIHAPRGGSDDPLTLGTYDTKEISIHAPRGGSDIVFFVGLIAAWVFQSTLPVGGATGNAACE